MAFASSFRISAVLLVVLLVAPILPGPMSVAAQPNGDTEPAPDDHQAMMRWVVGLEPFPRDLAAGDRWLGATVHRAEPDHGYAVMMSNDPEFESNAGAASDVIWVEPDFLVELDHRPNDPRYSSQYAPQISGMPLAWNRGIGARLKTVCIVDTGIRSGHEEFSGRILAGWDFGDNDASYQDGHGHGTHVAGIALATRDNGKGIAGMHMGGILVAKVSQGTGQTIFASDTAAGVTWCVDNGADVISLSLGSTEASSAQRTAVEYAWAKGRLVFASSGNSGCTGCAHYPSDLPEVVSVGAVDSSVTRTWFSQGGPNLELMGGGDNILAPCRTGDDDYCHKSGTSMSAPAVAGAAAFVWSHAYWLGHAEIRELLQTTAWDRGAPGFDDAYGYGVINAAAALEEAGTLIPQEPILTESFDGSAPVGWDMTGLWHRSSLCGPAASQPNYLGFHHVDECDYDDGLFGHSGTVTFPVDLTGLIQATLTFDHRWETEADANNEMDIMQVEIQGDSGFYEVLARWDSRDANQPEWNDAEIFLNNHVGQIRNLRFFFGTVDGAANVGFGWNIDDVIVWGGDTYPPVADPGLAQTKPDGDGDGGETFTFDGSSSFDSDGTIVEYAWFVDDVAAGNAPTLTATLDVGVHEVRLDVTDDKDAVGTATTTATVAPNTPPVASAVPPSQHIDSDNNGVEIVALDGRASTDTDGQVTQYLWKKDHVTVAAGALAEIDLPVGTHSIELHVQDNGGATDTQTFTATILPNVAPNADAGPDVSVSDGANTGVVPVSLDGTGSSDESDVVGFSWSLGGTVIGTSSSLTHDFTIGTNAVTLTVTDDGGAMDTDEVIVEVAPNQAPGATFLAACQSTACTFDGSTSHDDSGPVTGFSWTFGDGTTAIGAAAEHEYDAEDSYEVCLTATDAHGVQSTACRLVHAIGLVYRTDFDGTPDHDLTMTGEWRVDDRCSSGKSPQRYLGYHQADACHHMDGSGAGTAQFTVVLPPDVPASLQFWHRWDTHTDWWNLARMKFLVRDSVTGDETLLDSWDARDEDRLDWHAKTYDLGAFVGRSIDIRFSFDAGTSSRWARDDPGWFIDDIQVGNPAGFLVPNQVPLVALQPYQSLYRDGDGDGFEQVTLRAANITDPDGAVVRVEWYDGSDLVGVGESLTLNRPVGAHVLELAAFDDRGGVARASAAFEVRANEEPSVHITGPLTVLDVDADGHEAVMLDGSASHDIDGAIATMRWHDADSGVVLGTEDTVLVQQAANGLDRTVRLTVTDQAGASSETDWTFRVLANRAPVATVDPLTPRTDFDGTGAEAYVLDAGASSDPDGNALAFAWSLNEAPIGTGATLPYDVPTGSHTVRVVVTDQQSGLSDEATQVVTVNPNGIPVAVVAPVPYTNDEDYDGFETIRLDGRASHDDGGIVSYRWVEGPLTLSEAALVDIGLPVGAHEVTLEVTDEAGVVATEVLSFLIDDNRPPRAIMSATCGVLSCSFHALSAFDPDGDALTYSWTFGDGTTAQGVSVLHDYATGGTFSACLTVNDGRGKSDTRCQLLEFFVTGFFEDFEAPIVASFERDGLWRVTDSCSDAKSGERYLGYHSPAHCTYTAANTGASGGDAFFTIDLTGGDHASLTFAYKRVVEDLRTDRDVMSIHTRPAGSETWQLVQQWSSSDGNEDRWRWQTVDLSAHAGEPIDVLFRFDSKDALLNHYLGWLVDDVSIFTNANLPPAN